MEYLTRVEIITHGRDEDEATNNAGRFIDIRDMQPDEHIYCETEPISCPALPHAD